MNRTKKEIITDRDKAIERARWIVAQDYCIIDTETTGLVNPEMCQIAILHSDGHIYKTLVRPSKLIEPGATAVHHIKNIDVENSPMAGEILKTIPVKGIVIMYNAPFDKEVIVRSAAARNIKFEWGIPIHDAMLIYSAFKGEWDDYHGNYRWHKLGNACKQSGIEIDLDLHDAMADCIMTNRLIKNIAAQKLSSEDFPG
jgi:DNA polymerase III subunit epsilon